MKFLIPILLFSCLIIYSQDDVYIKNNFNIIYFKDIKNPFGWKEKDSLKIKEYLRRNKASNVLFVDFASGFKNDSVDVYLNDSLVFSNTLTANESSSFSYRLKIDYIPNSLYFLKIVLVNNNSTISFPLDLRYQFLQVIKKENIESEFDESFSLRYMNFPSMYQ